MMNNITNQNGRSMIEMLGVLAIVGVLSVGGIAGYSKAMQKYRVNKTIEQVTQIINGVRTLYSHQKNYQGINPYYSGPLRKAKILPESAWESTDQYAYPKNPFGGKYWMDVWDKTDSFDDKAAMLTIRNIPDDACIELTTQDWGAGEGLYAVNINSGVARGMTSGCSGFRNENEKQVLGCVGGNVPLPIPMDAAVSACASNNENELTFYFY